MFSDQVKALIAQAKQHKNSESRNSLISRLKDAHAHAVVMERDEFMASSPDPVLNSDLLRARNGEPNGCICPAPGVVSASCLAITHKLS